MKKTNAGPFEKILTLDRVTLVNIGPPTRLLKSFRKSVFRPGILQYESKSLERSCQ